MARYTTADPYMGERERQYLSDRALDSQLAVYSPDTTFNSISTIAPAYGVYPHSSSGALVRSNVIEEPVVEHEHHHVHHHIDHGGLGTQVAVAARPRVSREYSYDDLYDRERRYGSGMSLGSLGHHHHGYRHGHRHHGVGRFARSDIDLDLGATYRRRSSIYDDRESELAIIDVPAGTRRVTVDMGREADINWRRDNGVRRSRGLGSELWTEITKDLVTREAIEYCGYQYEETEFFYYIFEYLHRDQINELVDITHDVRRQRVRDLEYDSIAGVGHSHLDRRIDFERDETRTEIIIEGAGGRRGSRHRNRYYH